MRKPSPISTSSPRETITSPSRLVAARASSTAAALLLTTRASAAPVRAHSTSRTWRWRVARSPRGHVDLEIGVRSGRGGDRGAAPRRGSTERAEVGVGDHAGGVDHAAQRRRDGGGDQLFDPRHEVGGREGGGVVLSPAIEYLAPQALDDGAHGPHDHLARVGLGKRRDRRLAQHLVDGGQAAQRPAAPAAGRLVVAGPGAAAGAARSQQRHLADRTVHDLTDRPAARAALRQARRAAVRGSRAPPR